MLQWQFLFTHFGKSQYLMYRSCMYFLEKLVCQTVITWHGSNRNKDPCKNHFFFSVDLLRSVKTYFLLTAPWWSRNTHCWIKNALTGWTGGWSNHQTQATLATTASYSFSLCPAWLLSIFTNFTAMKIQTFYPFRKNDAISAVHRKKPINNHSVWEW